VLKSPSLIKNAVRSPKSLYGIKGVDFKGKIPIILIFEQDAYIEH
jgi:hypothetical protein